MAIISFGQRKCERKQKSNFFAKIQSSFCEMEKFPFTSNENEVENTSKFAKILNKMNEFRSFSFANFVQRKFRWKPMAA